MSQSTGRGTGQVDSRRGGLLRDGLAIDPVYGEPYFYGLIPRNEVEMMLLHEGEFLVRQSKKVYADSAGAVVSVRWRGSVVHIAILKSRNGYVLENQTFPTVKELIEHCVRHGTVLTNDSGVILKQPVKRAKWVLHDSQLKLKSQLGEGQFGEVWEAELTTDAGQRETVAVKRLKAGNIPSTEQKAFFDECRKQRQLKHLHIVSFKGVAMDKNIMLVMELCDTTLLKYVRANIISEAEELKMMVHASRGMAYLASEKIIHRDLAARNCLLKGDVLKISDLGMARTGDLYKMQDSKQKPIPIKWIPPDTLLTRKYSEKSDVWAFGVLMWEIVTRGCSPYADVQLDDRRPFVVELIGYLRLGNRLKIPPRVNSVLQNLMHACWQYEAAKRPFFKEIQQKLEDLYGKINACEQMNMDMATRMQSRKVAQESRR